MSKPTTCKLCSSAPVSRGLCGACASWTRYHQNAGHGPMYFLDYSEKHERLLRRASAALGKVKRLVRRRA